MLSHLWGEAGVCLLFPLRFSLDSDLTRLPVPTPPGDPHPFLPAAQGGRVRKEAG